MMLGIDVGGANTKAATSDGSFVRLIYAPLYRNKALLHGVLADVKRGLEAEGKEIKVVGAVMTGELCGCFNTKRAGVFYIAKAVSAIFENPLFFNTDCAFKNNPSGAKSPLSFAATNWLASAQFLSEKYKDVIFVDIGSTTTDVIPIVGGEIKAEKTDFARLKSGELIYSGVLRTSVAALLTRVAIGGVEYRLSSEYFATTADVYLMLGYTRTDVYQYQITAGYSPSIHVIRGTHEENGDDLRINAMRRLARVVCCDLDDIGAEGAVTIAKQVYEKQVEELIDSLKRIIELYGLETVVSAGIGDFIVKKAADSLNTSFISLSSIYGVDLSAVFPAYAVAKLLEASSSL